jgi:hypothetical protein
MIRSKEDLIQHFGSKENLEEFLIEFTKPISFLRFGIEFKN